MANIILHKYKLNEKDSGFNAPHKYRIAVHSSQPDDYINHIANIWRNKKDDVLRLLLQKVKQTTNHQSKFAFAIAPSDTPFFCPDLRTFFLREFPNAIDITECFSKTANTSNTTTNTILTEAELRNRFSIDKVLFQQKIDSATEISFILLLDDVHALGNTFNGLELLIRDILPEVSLLTAAILKT